MTEKFNILTMISNKSNIESCQNYRIKYKIKSNLSFLPFVHHFLEHFVTVEVNTLLTSPSQQISRYTLEQSTHSFLSPHQPHYLPATLIFHLLPIAHKLILLNPGSYRRQGITKQDRQDFTHSSTNQVFFLPF